MYKATESFSRGVSTTWAFLHIKYFTSICSSIRAQSGWCGSTPFFFHLLIIMVFSLLKRSSSSVPCQELYCIYIMIQRVLSPHKMLIRCAQFLHWESVLTQSWVQYFLLSIITNLTAKPIRKVYCSVLSCFKFWYGQKEWINLYCC